MNAVAYAPSQHRIVAEDHSSYESEYDEAVIPAKTFVDPCTDENSEANHNQSHSKKNTIDGVDSISSIIVWRQF